MPPGLSGRSDAGYSVPELLIFIVLSGLIVIAATQWHVNLLERVARTMHIALGQGARLVLHEALSRDLRETSQLEPVAGEFYLIQATRDTVKFELRSGRVFRNELPVTTPVRVETFGIVETHRKGVPVYEASFRAGPYSTRLAIRRRP